MGISCIIILEGRMMSTFENVKAAIFDLDGTLVDSMYVWNKVDEDFMKKRGIEVTEEYAQQVRSMFFETAAVYTKQKFDLSESVEEIMQEWLDMAHEEYACNVPSKPYAYVLLKKLRQRGILLGLATSNNPYLLKPCLENNGMSGMFDCICYTSEVGMNKSNPEIYLYTAEKLGVLASECIVFEDIIEGLKSASSVGMKTIAVYDKANEKQMDEIKITADRLIYNYEELIDEMPGML